MPACSPQGKDDPGVETETGRLEPGEEQAGLELLED